MKTEKKIKVMQAYLDGETIEWREKDSDEWSQFSKTSFGAGPVWDWGGQAYRIKPEPREFWVRKVYYNDGSIGKELHTSKPSDSDSYKTEIFKVREVL